MTIAADSSAPVVLVSWVSVNHRAAPILTAIADPKAPYRRRVRRVYLCSRETAPPDGDRERVALKETVKELHAQLDPVCPEIHKVPWKTAASPTDHAAIRAFAEPLLKRVRDENPDAAVVIHLSPGTPAMHAVWLALGSMAFISGPVELIQTADERGRAAGQPPVQVVHFSLDTWLRRFRAATPQDAGAEDAGHLWDPARAISTPLREALEKLGEWAPLRVPVLLVGERGTGKTTLANLLRARSPFQGAGQDNWPTVVCGQFRVNPQLARSELFGHVRGAFTGATGDREGLLEQAHNDSVFFDEIADIDRDTQRLLMAALEGRGFQRLGDAKVRYSQFRLICATNRSLAELRADLLDPDFLDRIAVFVLPVPPLRQCKEDQPHAWRQVLTVATRRAGVSPPGWEAFLEHPGLLGAFRSHPLPGNFRDLQRAAYHLLAALEGGRGERAIIARAVGALGPAEVRGHAVPEASELAALMPVNDLRHQLHAYERAWLAAALTKASGNKSEAARLVGLPRKTFEHRLRALSSNPASMVVDDK